MKYSNVRMPTQKLSLKVNHFRRSCDRKSSKRNKELIKYNSVFATLSEQIKWFPIDLIHVDLLHWDDGCALCSCFHFLCAAILIYRTFELCSLSEFATMSNKEQEIATREKRHQLCKHAMNRAEWAAAAGRWYACTWNMWCIAKRNVISTHQRLCGDSPCSFQQNIISFCIVARSPLLLGPFFLVLLFVRVCIDVFFLFCAILLQLNSSVDVYKVPFHYRIAMYYNNCLYGHKLHESTLKALHGIGQKKQTDGRASK